MAICRKKRRPKKPISKAAWKAHIRVAVVAIQEGQLKIMKNKVTI